jgi:hypothetical protein
MDVILDRRRVIADSGDPIARLKEGREGRDDRGWYR